MNKIIFKSLLFCFALCSCNSIQDNGNKEQVFHIDLNEDTNELEKHCSPMDIRLVQLESIDTCIFNDEAARLRVVDDYVFIADISQSIIFRFNKNGEYMNQIFQKGQGDKEYKAMFSTSFNNGNIYIQDHDRIQVYDYEGKYLKSIPHKRQNDDIYIVKQQVYIRENYINEFQIKILDETNKIIAEYLPPHEKLRGFNIPTSNHTIMGSYDDGVYVANPMDYNIYLIKDTVYVLAKLDFGTMNLPTDFFEGSSRTVEENFRKARATLVGDTPITKAITMINNLIVTDDWITFVPESFDPAVVYCNRKEGTSFTNKGLKEPYATFFKGYKSPQGYDPKTKEFYLLVNSMELKEMIESLKESDGNDYEKKYPFLKGINTDEIQDDTNAWMLFFKMRT